MFITQSAFKSTVSKRSMSAGHSFLQIGSYAFCQAVKADLQQERETEPAHGERHCVGPGSIQAAGSSCSWVPATSSAPSCDFIFRFLSESMPHTGILPINSPLWREGVNLRFYHFQPTGTKWLTVHMALKVYKQFKSRESDPGRATGKSTWHKNTPFWMDKAWTLHTATAAKGASKEFKHSAPLCGWDFCPQWRKPQVKVA